MHAQLQVLNVCVQVLNGCEQTTRCLACPNGSTITMLPSTATSSVTLQTRMPGEMRWVLGKELRAGTCTHCVHVGTLLWRQKKPVQGCMQMIRSSICERISRANQSCQRYAAHKACPHRTVGAPHCGCTDPTSSRIGSNRVQACV